jgi:hypothetical protein
MIVMKDDFDAADSLVGVQKTYEEQLVISS